MNTQYQLVTTAAELRLAVDDLSTRQAIGLDTETTDLDPYLARLRLIQLASSDGVFIVDLNRFVETDLKRSEGLAPLRRLLSAPRPIKIAHNAKFDAKFIKHNLGVDIVGLFDTLLASQLVSAGDIEERHGLEAIAGRYLNEAVDKTERLSNWEFDLSQASLFGPPRANINLDSQPQVTEALTRLGIPLPDSTRNWKLQPLAAQYPVVAKLLEYRTMQKALTSYGQNVIEFINPKTGRLH